MSNIELPNKTALFFYSVCKYMYLCTVGNFWSHQLSWSRPVRTLMERSKLLIDILLNAFVISSLLSFFTQKELSEKQASDRLMFCISHPILYFSFLVSVSLYRTKIIAIVEQLSLTLKAVYNDEATERQMLGRAKLFGVIYSVYVSMVFVTFGIDGIFQVASKGQPFVTVVPVWPGTTDPSAAASVARGILYLLWALFLVRTSAIYLLVLLLTICLSHQYTNLQAYFRDLNQIFESNLGQKAKEAKYERDLKIGIRLHAETLWCTQEVKKAFKILFSGQILLSISVLVLLMLQMMQMSSRSVAGVLAVLLLASSVLFITGMFMWNAGDITVEAALVPAAMYSSGWQHCRGSARHRVRRTLAAAIRQGQVPVVIKVLGVIDLSYSSYLTIVKTSYSVFSVLY
uniref:Odorant receptor n=1 Tax=Plutella xylostella TaxID=51655 RepID=A0A8G1GM46_PLUXY|nr:odorant receptor 53 [Plutella xylostella]